MRAIAAQDGPILITGETGTGKSVLARHLRSLSKRKDKPLIVRGCGEFDVGTVEAQLFGHSRDAYTGASTEQDGVFQQANGGTLVLDDVDYLPKPMQTRLLRFLDDGTFHRLGESDRPRRANVRLIVTSNKDLQALSATGQFLPDLFFRLSHWRIMLSPLRSQPEAVRTLANRLLARFDQANGEPPRTFSQDALDLLACMAWPGNVRELKATVENIALEVMGTRRTVIGLDGAAAILLDPHSGRQIGGLPLLPDLSEDERMFRLLVVTGWNISLSASLLGVSRNTIYDRVRTRGWRRPA
ncbi:DNA-binding NtrC family response regulator [Azospirillum soli]|nr:DNA-binding NtrC family response regulator [Azospirillum soli]